MTAVAGRAVPTPTRDEDRVWCGAVHPTAYLVICRRVRHSIDVLHSPTETGLDDWAGPSRVSPPTTSNKETRNER